MKKIIYILTAIIFIGLSQSCSDFLVEDPESQLVLSNFYTSQNDAESAINAIYNALYSVNGRNLVLLSDLITDDMKNGIGMSNSHLQDIEYLRLTSETSFNTSMWQNLYVGVSRANTAINNMKEGTMPDAALNIFLGEARFLRALFFFNATRFWGDVPLITKIEGLPDAYLPLTPQSEVFQLIINDLTFAADYLPTTNADAGIGRATAGAAKIMLGKVYLYMEEWQLAANVLSDVVDSESTYGYALNDDYRDNFEINTENGSEMVFSIQYAQSPGTANFMMAGSAPKYSINGGSGVPGIFGAWEADIPTVELYNAFDDADERKAATFKIDWVSPTDGETYTSDIPIFYKYVETGETSCYNGDVNFPVLRYSDALLMYAEALTEIGGDDISTAETLLNRVRERAFNGTAHNYSGLSQSECREMIRNERRLEFACEGQRYFDLTRWGIFTSTMQTHGDLEATLTGETIKESISNNVADYHSYFPIPQHEIDLNSEILQNDEY